MITQKDTLTVNGSSLGKEKNIRSVHTVLVLLVSIKSKHKTSSLKAEKTWPGAEVRMTSMAQLTVHVLKNSKLALQIFSSDYKKR